MNIVVEVILHVAYATWEVDLALPVYFTILPLYGISGIATAQTVRVLSMHKFANCVVSALISKECVVSVGKPHTSPTSLYNSIKSPTSCHR